MFAPLDMLEACSQRDHQHGPSLPIVLKRLKRCICRFEAKLERILKFWLLPLLSW